MLANKIDEEAVFSALKTHLGRYPGLRLTDLYKSFFQDRFGPGHIVANPAEAAGFLARELGNMQHSAMLPFEYTGWQNRYVRVNLNLIKSGIITQGSLLDAFIESAGSATPPPDDDWKEEWQQIAGIVKKHYSPLLDFDSDLRYIDKRLKARIYDMHHSEPFRAAYNPHYRIVDARIFEEKIHSLIKKFIPLHKPTS